MMRFPLRTLALFRKSALDADFSEELRTHVEMLQEEWMRRGLSAEDALLAARRDTGNLESHKELHRDTRGVPLLDTLMQDLRFTFRTLRRDSTFAVFAILIAGLGIAATATVFSVVNALLIRPLPFREPDRLAWIANHASGGMSGATTQVDHMRDLREQAKSFTDIAGYFAFYGNGDLKLTGGTGEPERLSGVMVTNNFFPMLGVQPALGRAFAKDECPTFGCSIVMISHTLWVWHFNADPGILGRKLILNGSPAEIIGVLPATFDFGAVFAPGSRIDVFSPFPMNKETNSWGNTMAMVGRLAPGATVQSAQAEVSLLARQLSEAHKNDRNDFEGHVTQLATYVSGGMRPALLILVCAVGAVMLIVCANLSSLLLGRTAARQKEIAVRAALGAGRGRLIRQMLTESTVLAFAGTAFGLILAFAGTYAISHIQTLKIPLLDDVSLDSTALLFLIGAAVVTGLAFGLLPAVSIRNLALHDSLKDAAGRGLSHGRGHAYIRKALVAAEVAFACMLLIGTGLLVRSLHQVMSVNLGFNPEQAAAIRIDPDSRYQTQAQQNAYFSEALRLVRDTPGVTAAGITDCLPLGANRGWTTAAVGEAKTQNDNLDAFPRIITEGYLRALGIAMISGRDFTERDTTGSDYVAIINHTLAQRLWPGQDPLGKRLYGLGGKPTVVVGVVRDVRHLALEQEAGNEMYFPLRQTGDHMAINLVVRSTLPTVELAGRVRQALLPVEPNLPSHEFRPIQTMVDMAISPRRFLVLLLSGFAVFALVLAALGIYAVISYSVAQRRQELGIRLALGASATNLQLGIVFETLRLAAVGMAAGVALAWFASRSIESLLYGVKPGDPGTFVAALVGLLCVAGLAGYVPARRVLSIDATAALRGS